MVLKSDGQWRVCGDYRLLNTVTVPDKFPIPFLHDFAVNLNGKKIFSKLDLHAAYHQIPVFPDDVPKTAVTTPFGLFEFLFMPFGLRNAGQTFQRYMFQALGDLNFIFVYLDDILIASKDKKEHGEHLDLVCSRLNEYGLKLNLDKCVIGREEIEFLGHLLNENGFRPTTEKVRAISEFTKPRTIHELRRFLGLVNFYRRNVPRAVQLQRPLNEYLHDTRKNDKREIVWTSEAEQAFIAVKEALAKATLLAYPSSSAPTRLVTDASDLGMGATLEQFLNNSWQALAFYSKKFNSPQSKYSTYDRELTAMYEAVKYFRYFLEGHNFKIVTDHKPLIFAFQKNSEKASPRQQRQLSFLSQFATEIEYLPGIDNVVADALSRSDAITFPTEIDLAELAQAQTVDEELKLTMQDANSSLKLRNFVWDILSITCDISGDNLRPYIPSPLRKRIFNLIHNSAHPGGKITDRLIRKKYVWPFMNRDVKNWCRSCIQCQRSKVTRHTTMLPSHFIAPDSRFLHVHMDIIGPLPVCDGFKYCLTLINRFSRWPEAIPLKDIEASTVCRAFFDGWISCYGSPETLSTDQGSQFESRLFKALLNLTGCNRIRTTPYHPAANGLIERWHRTLKAAIMCHNNAKWLYSLSTVLMGLRNNVLDSGASPSEYLYGTTLRIPGEFILPEDFLPIDRYSLKNSESI